MEYISSERHVKGSCRDPEPLFGDQDGSLLDHLDYQGGDFEGGVQQHESPTLDEGLLVDPADEIQNLSADSLPFMNDQITGHLTKSASASPEPLLKQDQGPLDIKFDMQNDHNSNFGAEVTPVGCDDVHKSPEVISALLPQELPESTGNDTSNMQPETTHSPRERFARLESDTPPPDGRKSPERFERLERDTPPPDGRESPERFERLERDTPLAVERVSPRVRSPHASHSEKMESQHTAKDDLARSESPPARHQSKSPERHDTHRKRASPRESSHAQNDSPVERKRRRESQHGDGSPRQRSASPRRRSTPRRRSASPRRSSHKRRSLPRRDSPRRDSRRKESPTRRDSSRRRGSPRRRGRSKSRSPSRRTDSSRHRREHDRSRSRSPHSRDHHRRSRSRSPHSRDHHRRSRSRSPHSRDHHRRSRSRSPHSRDHHRRSPRRHSPRRRTPPSSHRHHSPKRHWSPPANRKTGLGKPGRNLFVAGFSYATTERELEKKFAKYGRVTSARVVRDKRTGDSRGFGFLSLEKDEDADAAIRACDETEWNGRIILVEKSKAPTW